MKAWIVRNRRDGFYSTVVFAETRGKAKSRALATDCCEDVPYCDLETRRAPQLDKCYKDGKTEMDWYDPKDRLTLVKECGFMCDFETFQVEDCSACSAKAFCDRYTDVEESEG